jgi:hypothetical protein
MDDANLVKKCVIALCLTPELGVLARSAAASNLLAEAETGVVTAEMEQGYISSFSLRIIQKVASRREDVVEACRGARLVFPRHRVQTVYVICVGHISCITSTLHLHLQESCKDEAFLKRRKHLIQREEERQYNQMVFGSPE